MNNSKRISLRTVLDKDKLSAKVMKNTIGGLNPGFCNVSDCVQAGYAWDYDNGICEGASAGCTSGSGNCSLKCFNDVTTEWVPSCPSSRSEAEAMCNGVFGDIISCAC